MNEAKHKLIEALIDNFTPEGATHIAAHLSGVEHPEAQYLFKVLTEDMLGMDIYHQILEQEGL